MNRAASVVLVALALASSLAAQAPPGRQDSYREEARVERVVVDAHVVDRRGDPMTDLTAEDFLVKVDGKVVPLESAEWVPADMPEVPADAVAAASDEPGRPLPAPGRLIVLFFQTDYNYTRLVGLLRMSLQAKRFLDGLLPTDRVAVVSYDSHLKLRQDFTSDRRKLEDALFASIRTAEPVRDMDPYSPSLARNFDFAEAKKASTPERGLLLIASALPRSPAASRCSTSDGGSAPSVATPARTPPSSRTTRWPCICWLRRASASSRWTSPKPITTRSRRACASRQT